MTTFKMEFDSPQHGWLPVQLSFGEGAARFVASDVPNNPVEDLIEALELALRNIETCVCWNLEPDAYYFEFSPHISGVQLRISFASCADRRKDEEVLVVSGTKREVLLPVWRSLRRFESFSLGEPHWPSLDFFRLQQIYEALRGAP